MSEKISVSNLSSYAANPVKFCEFKGGAYNKKAAKNGTERHDKAGRTPIVIWLSLLAFVIAALWIF